MSYPIVSAQYIIDRDLRVKAPGGLSYTASTDATDIAPLSGGDNSLVWVGIPSDGAFCLVKNALGNATGFSIISGTIHTLVDGVSDDTGIAAPTRLTEFQVDFTASTGEYTFYVERELVFTSAGGDSAPAYTKRDGWTDAFTGSALLSRNANFTLTSDEAEGAAKGESRGRLALRAVSTTSSSFSELTDTNNRLTVAGTNFAKTAGTEATFVTCWAEICPKLPLIEAKGLARVTLTVTLNSGLAADLPVLVYGDGATYLEVATLVVGTHTYTFPAFYGNTAGNHFLTLNWSATLGVTGGATNFDIAQPVVLEALGTIASYEPGNCTSLNRWLDNSGNNYHLLPVGGAKALNPQPVQVRTEEFRYDLATSTASDSPQDWTLVKTGTGVMTATPAAYNFGIKPPICQASSETVDHVTTAATNQSTGVVTISNTLATVATDAVIQGILTHRE